MQLNFSHFALPKLGRQMFRLRCVFVLCSILVMVLASNAVNGQTPFYRQHGNGPYRDFGPPQPRDFGDTPSPTEMLARLKFHKQQETPLFDLLQEAGSDIFSKLNDNEKKLAGRFIEDMILKEGVDSERVSSLMKHMNISPEARQALKQGIERAGGGESAISPEDRKAIANNVRQQILQQSGDLQSGSGSSSNQTLQPPNRFAGPDRLNIENETQNPRLAPSAASDTDAVVNDTTRSQQLQQRIAELAETLKTKTRELSSADPSRESAAGSPAAQRRRSGNSQLPPPARSTQPKIAGSEASTKPPSRDSAAAALDNALKRFDLNRSEAPFSTDRLELPGFDPESNKLAQDALRQFKSHSEASQQKILSDVQEKLRDGDLTPRQMEELFSDLQSAKSPDQFADRIEEASKRLGLPADSREKIMESLGQLSATDDTFSRTGAADNAGGDKIGRDLLQDALQFYSDPESGYELSGAFKRLKEHAEGIHSDRPLANFGKISQKLFEDSSKIFDADSMPDARKASGVKPGQRLDQLLTAAATEAIANSGQAKEKKDDSVFSGMLNSALGVALDQAVTLADDGELGLNGGDDSQNWNNHTNALSNNDPLSSRRDFGSPQPNAASQSPSIFSGNNSPPPPITSTSPSQSNSIQKSVSAITDSMLDAKFSWQGLFSVLGIVGLLILAVVGLRRILVPASPALKKQAELQRKLKQNSSNPKDVVEAVDLFLLSRFGNASSWWNAKHAADQISEAKPDWRDKVASLFQVYRWSRYQAAGNDNVSPEQNKLVVDTLQELIDAPPEAFGSEQSSMPRTVSTDDDDEAKA